MGNSCQKKNVTTPVQVAESPDGSHEVKVDGAAPAAAVVEESPDAVYVRVMQPLLCAAADLSGDVGLLSMANGNEGRVSFIIVPQSASVSAGTTGRGSIFLNPRCRRVRLA
jgi:hypothetical protein